MQATEQNVTGKQIPRINLTQEQPDAEMDRLAGTFIEDDSYDTLITESTDVYKPNGELLLAYRKEAISLEICSAVYPIFKAAAKTTNNRGIAAGKEPEPEASQNRQQKDTSTRFREVKADGTLSNTTRGNTVYSSLLGYFDRSARFPYCRLTAYNLEKAAEFAKAEVFIRAADAVFKEAVPERHRAQMEYMDRTHPDFKIKGTAFTTVSVNRNFRTAVHKDAGDLKQGFGVIAGLRAGIYTWGLFVIPKYRVAVDIGTGDVLCCDVHEWHGNTKIHGKPGKWERISLVLYYRERMHECGSPEEELRRANEGRNGINPRG